jgi:Protein of unknown function (DUF1566)
LKSTRRRKVGLVTLLAGLLITISGLGVTLASADPPIKESGLAGVTQNWDKNLPSASRFVVLSAFNNEAVRDNETGLVWEKTPDTTFVTWSGARGTCADKNVGGRKGWRLPSFAELASLVDPSVASAPVLPTGHPFTNIEPTIYWSATTGAELPVGAWAVNFDVPGSVLLQGKTSSFLVWCVRGGMNADAY